MRFVVQACGSAAYPGLTVSIYTGPGGSLVDSGTTAADGGVNLHIPASGSYWVAITGQDARFAAFGGALSLLCSASTTINLTPAAGYACFAGCALPAATVLNCTVLGPWGTRTGTATYSGGAGGWVWSTTFGGFTFTVTFSGGAAVASTNFGGPCIWTNVSRTCPPALGYTASDRPTDGCGGGAGWSGSITATE